MAHKGMKKTRKTVQEQSDLPGTSFGNTSKKKSKKKSKKGISKEDFAQGYCVCK